MRTVNISIWVVGLVLIIAPASADEAARTTHELVGFTTATFTCDQGVLGFTLACQAEFGSDTRMCNSVEVMRTVNVPAGLSGTAWVRPVLTGIGAAAVDASGEPHNPIHLTCRGWSNSFFAGLSVDANGKFLTLVGISTLSVSCCGPIPEADRSQRP